MASPAVNSCSATIIIAGVTVYLGVQDSSVGASYQADAGSVSAGFSLSEPPRPAIFNHTIDNGWRTVYYPDSTTQFRGTFFDDAINDARAAELTINAAADGIYRA